MRCRLLVAFSLFAALGLPLCKSADATWTRRKAIGANDRLAVREGPSVAVSGNAIHVAWGYGRDVRYSRSLDCGETWTRPKSLQTQPWGPDPAIAAEGNNVHLVWFEGDENPTLELYHSVSRDAGVTWSAPTRLSEEGRYSEYPSIAVAGKEVHVAFSEGIRESGIGGLVRARTVVASSTDGGRSWIRRKLTRRSARAMVAIGRRIEPDRLRLHLVRSSDRKGSPLLYQVSDTAGARWSKPVQINEPSMAYQSPRGLAIVGAGAHVLWRRYQEPRILETIFNGSVNGSFRPVSQVMSGVLGPTSYSLDASLASARGVLHSVWEERRTEPDFADDIYTSSSGDRGETWSRPKRLAKRAGGNPTIAASGAATGLCKGSVHVVYRHRGKYVHRRRPRDLD